MRTIDEHQKEQTQITYSRIWIKFNSVSSIIKQREYDGSQYTPNQHGILLFINSSKNNIKHINITSNYSSATESSSSFYAAFQPKCRLDKYEIKSLIPWNQMIHTCILSPKSIDSHGKVFSFPSMNILILCCTIRNVQFATWMFTQKSAEGTTRIFCPVGKKGQ